MLGFKTAKAIHEIAATYMQWYQTYMLDTNKMQQWNLH